MPARKRKHQDSLDDSSEQDSPRATKKITIKCSAPIITDSDASSPNSGHEETESQVSGHGRADMELASDTGNAQQDDTGSDKRETLANLLKSVDQHQKTTAVLRKAINELEEDNERLGVARFRNSDVDGALFVEGLIWYFVWKEMLNEPFKVWGSKAFEFAKIILKNNATSYSRRDLWRRQTGDLLNESKYDTQLLESWEASFRHFLEPLLPEADDADKVSADITAIISNGFDFAQKLARSRTRYIIKRNRPGKSLPDPLKRKYDEVWMFVTERSIIKSPFIDFVVVPALLEKSNAAGDLYDEPWVLRKAEVCCGKSKYDSRREGYTRPPERPGRELQSTLI